MKSMGRSWLVAVWIVGEVIVDRPITYSSASRIYLPRYIGRGYVGLAFGLVAVAATKSTHDDVLIQSLTSKIPGANLGEMCGTRLNQNWSVEGSRLVSTLQLHCLQCSRVAFKNKDCFSGASERLRLGSAPSFD